jgi:uncharacterized repeat protein (TIGR01451 family)
MRRSLALILGLIAAAAFVGGAGATTGKVDLSTRAGVMQYLRAHGIDTHGIVIQRGSRNYVGARCPGARWTCTRASRVVQIATGANAVNRANLTDSDPSQLNSCLGGSVTQVNTTGDNVVMASITSGSPQTCSVLQQNASGKNIVQLEEVIKQGSGSSQTAMQDAFVTQYNLGGANSFQLKQSVTQSISETVNPVSESQESTQRFRATQYNDNLGPNSSQVTQSLSQSESDTRASTGTQYQKATLNGHVDQYSDGLSTSQNKQSENQTQTAKTNGSVVQTQIGPAWCCSVQQNNTGDIFRIDQSSNQSSGKNADQSEEIVGTCGTTGLCKVSQSYTKNGVTTTNSCQGTFCNTGILSDDGTTTTCVPSEIDAVALVVFGCPGADELPGAPSPPDAYCSQFLQCPDLLTITKSADSESVEAGNPIGFTVTLTNNGPEAVGATNVKIQDPLPGGSGYDWVIESQLLDDSATSSCHFEGAAPSQVLNCTLSTLAAGSSLTVHVTSATDCGSDATYDNNANYTSSNAGNGSASASENLTYDSCIS